MVNQSVSDCDGEANLGSSSRFMITLSAVDIMSMGQTVYWIGAQFFVCMFLVSRDKSLNMFQNESGFRVQIPVT